MPTFIAAIFDFDGTLVDTMPIHYEAYRRVLADAGIDLSPADFYGSVGGKAAETIPRFLRGRPCSLSVPEIHSRKKAVVRELLLHGPIPVLETAKLLSFLRGQFRLALVSSGSRPGIDIVLARLGWTRTFETVITGEDCRSGKPDPEPFLLAAERLGVDPGACLVFEDTDDGVKSALAAGMEVFDVRGTTPARHTDVRGA